MKKERRNFQRISIDSYAALILGEQEWEAEVLNISLQGAMLKCRADLPLLSSEDSFTVRIEQEGIALEIEALLNLQEGSVVRLKFHNIELESLTYLRQLIESLTGDFEEVRNELGYLSGD